MYKNLEVLSKEKFQDIKFNNVSAAETGKTLSFIPVGFAEIIDMCSIAPVIIFGNEDELEFIGLFGLTPEMSVFNKQQLLAPLYLRSYPFVNIVAKNDDKLTSVIGIDKNKDHVSKKATNSIFDGKGELTKEANAKVEMVRELNRQREVSKALIKLFKEKNLLVQKDFKVKVGDKEKVIVEKFYVIDREKMMQLDDAILVEWTKKGWTTLVDCHLKSLSNFGLIASI